jgi:DNA-binding FadR family transcriptional regulator
MSRLLLNAFAATQQEYRDKDGAVNDLAAGFRYHNHVLIQLASVIRALMRALFELTTHLGAAHEQALDLHGPVVEAIRLRQPDAARAAIVRILEGAVSDLSAGNGPTLS